MKPSLLPLLVSLAASAAMPAIAQEPEAQFPDPFRRLRAEETPEALYSKGLGQLKRGYYDEAILNFEKVRNHFPFNQYSVLAELRVADCLYEKAAYLEAVDAYLRFSRLHPRHPEIDYVVYRTARAEFKLAPIVPQRDQSPAKRGLKRLRSFEERFPDSQYTEAVGNLRRRALTRISRGALQVGNFYWKQREWKAAERRYRLVADEFEGSPLAYKARYRQARCLWRLDRPGEAALVLENIVTESPEGRWGRAAQAFLARNADALTAPAVEGAPPSGEPNPGAVSVPSGVPPAPPAP